MAPDGTVYVSGEQGQIYRIEPDDAATEVATTGGWTLGLASDSEGRIYACDPARHAVLRWTPGRGDPVVWTSGTADSADELAELGRLRPGWRVLRLRLRRLEGAATDASTSSEMDAPGSLPASRSTSPTASRSHRTVASCGCSN